MVQNSRESFHKNSSMIFDKGTIGFRPKARLLKNLLGDELVSNEIVSIVELVKNSYDADADNVWITIDKDFIIVIDDGCGMTKEEVLNNWFQPATTNKKISPYSKKGRPVLGNKGIGRFATARLGDIIQLTTRAEKETNETYFELDWEQFKNEDLFLDQIIYNWEVINPTFFLPLPPEMKPTELHPGPKGTRMIIKKLRDDILWSENKIR